MNQNQVNELLLEALLTTEIDVTLGICQCKRTIFKLSNKYSVIECLLNFEALLIVTCKDLRMYSGSHVFPIKGGNMTYRANASNLWDMDTEYGQWRHRVYDQMVFTLQDKLGITK